MKHSSFKFICLIVWACITVFSGFGDEVTNSLETKVLESFNGDSDLEWKAVGSRFTSKVNSVTYPLTSYIEAWPIAVFGYNKSSDNSPLKSFGINGRFDRQGYNWIDIYPTLSNDPDTPYEIPMPGRIHNMDMWVWGANLKFYIEVYVRDYMGVVHALKLGDISYTGWKNLKVSIPNTIRQSRRILPSYAGLHFVKFRIWTQPVEKVDNFYIYFKQFKVLTDVFESLFDGNDLADPSNVERLWANN